MHKYFVELDFNCIQLHSFSLPYVTTQRYFVLSESSSYFCVLRIYAKAVTTQWGVVATGLRSSIPIASVENVMTVAHKASQGELTGV